MRNKDLVLSFLLLIYLIVLHNMYLYKQKGNLLSQLLLKYWNTPLMTVDLMREQGSRQASVS